MRDRSLAEPELRLPRHTAGTHSPLDHHNHHRGRFGIHSARETRVGRRTSGTAAALTQPRVRRVVHPRPECEMRHNSRQRMHLWHRHWRWCRRWGSRCRRRPVIRCDVGFLVPIICSPTRVIEELFPWMGQVWIRHFSGHVESLVPMSAQFWSVVWCYALDQVVNVKL
jgi:hypothetical protein